MLESLDVYRIVRFLTEAIGGPDDICAFVQKNTVIRELLAGFPILLLKTSGQDNRCTFLNGNRCIIQEAKPRACRLYPFVVGPNEEGNDFQYLLSMDKQHHFGRGNVKVQEWMKQYLNEEDKEFMLLEYRFIGELASIYARLPAPQLEKAAALNIQFHYMNYDLQRPFMEQFQENKRSLRKELMKLTRYGNESYGKRT